MSPKHTARMHEEAHRMPSKAISFGLRGNIPILSWSPYRALKSISLVSPFIILSPFCETQFKEVMNQKTYKSKYRFHPLY